MLMTIQDAIGYYGFVLFGVLAGAFWLIAIPYALIIHFLMPRTILDKYFKSPHFREGEIAFFSGIPFALMRTVMLVGVMVFPGLGKKRKLTELHLETPRWYLIAAKWSFYLFFGTGLGFVIVLALLGISAAVDEFILK
jgi:hypothetical protein